MSGRKWTAGVITGVVALSCVLVSVAPMGPAGAVSRSAATTAATPACTFDGSTLPIVTGVTDNAKVKIACTGLPALHPMLILQASLLIGIDPKAAALLSGGSTLSTGTFEAALAALPEVDAASLGVQIPGLNGTLNFTYTVPSFNPTDPNATCPPSELEFNAGLIGCALAMVDLTNQKPVAAGSGVLEWQGYPLLPPNPTVAFSATKKLAPGQQITVTDAPGATTYWWIATLVSLEALLSGGSSGPPPTATVVFEGKHHVLTNATSNLTVKSASYDGKTLTLPSISGNFTVPSGVSGRQKVLVEYSANLEGLGLVVVVPTKVTV